MTTMIVVTMLVMTMVVVVMIEWDVRTRPFNLRFGPGHTSKQPLDFTGKICQLKMCTVTMCPEYIDFNEKV